MSKEQFLWALVILNTIINFLLLVIIYNLLKEINNFKDILNPLMVI